MSDNKEVMIEVSRDHLVEETSVKKYQLNHCATEFVSESSTENYGSDSSEDGEHVQEEGTEESLTREHEQGDKDEATMKEEGKAMQRRRSRGLEEQQQHVPYGNMPVTWGWESPQGVLPPPMDQLRYGPLLRSGSPTPLTQGSGDVNKDEEGGDGAPGMERQISGTGLLPHPYSGGYPMGYTGTHYPVYPGYSAEAGTGVERAGSPPPMFPGGGSPPLGPGFFSVPVMSTAGGSPPPHPMMMYGCSPPGSLGSSPPGGAHFYYMQPVPHGPQGRDFDPRYDISQHMGMVSLGSSGSTKAGHVSSPPAKAGESRASARIARSHRAGGAYNPSDFEFDMIEAMNDKVDARKTIMIRNIPNKYSQATMLGMLDKAGLRGTFDFFYLPIDFRNKCGLGYAFINFLSAKYAAKLYEEFHNKRWDEFNSKKVCEIKYARVQGRDNLIEHFKTAKFPSHEAEYQPLIYIHQETISGKVALKEEPFTIHRYLDEVTIQNE